MELCGALENENSGVAGRKRRAGSDVEGPEALVACALADSPCAAEALWEDQAPALMRAAIAIGVPWEEARDVVQETLLYAFRSLSRFDPGRSSFRVWLHAILVGRCRNWRRARRRFVAAVADFLTDGRPAEPERPDEVLARREAQERLDRLIAGLSPRLRHVWALVEGAGLSCRDAACVLRVEEATVRSHLRHARAAIREAAQKENR